jgi:hypothetical protein
VQESVVTFGYARGGDSMCITAGVVSRVGVVSNVHCAFASVTAIQIDAAINAGASGGPAVQVGATHAALPERRVAGLSGLKRAQAARVAGLRPCCCMQGNKVVGVSFQGMGSGNVGYIIATLVVKLFLKGVKRSVGRSCRGSESCLSVLAVYLSVWQTDR